LHIANFDTRVCKFQIKAIGVNKYFNILEIYAKDTQQMLDRRMAELRRMVEEGEKCEEKEENPEKEEDKGDIEVEKERGEMVEE
jgi:hypothetical protein